MNLKEFAINNVVRNIKAYLAYFVSSTISATLLFSFTMIIFHPNFRKIDLPDYLINALNVTIVIAYSFLCFFVFYSVSVFLKRRYKEFGTLYIIGASKKQIQKMICAENIFICSSAGVLGTLIGIVFSKFLLALSGKLLGFDAMNFYFSFQAIIITLAAFISIGIIVSVFSSHIIKEDKVFKLLKGSNKPKTEPKTYKFLAILCVVMLAGGYYSAISSDEKSIVHRIIPVTIVVIIATYLLFDQLTTFIIKVLKKNRHYYMNKVKLLWISNLYYRIKDNTRIFFLITITTTMALTAIGGVYAYWSDKEAQIDKTFPESFFIYDSNFYKDDINDQISFIEDSLDKEKAKYSSAFGEIKFAAIDDGKSEIVLIDEGTYNSLLSILQYDRFQITDENLIMQCQSNVNKKKKDIKLGDIKLKVSEDDGEVILPAIFEEVYVVKDSVYRSVSGDIRYFGAVNMENYKDTFKICEDYNKNFTNDRKDKYSNSFLKAEIYEKTKAAYGVLLFSVIFIGLIFLVTTVSFLYNKCYMDVIEDKLKYKKLNEIGLTFKEIKKVVTIEVGVLFLMPYIIAIIHFYFAINALKYAFGIPVISVFLQIVGIMFFIQGIYYFIVRNNYLLEIKRGLIS